MKRVYLDQYGVRLLEASLEDRISCKFEFFSTMETPHIVVMEGEYCFDTDVPDRGCGFMIENNINKETSEYYDVVLYNEAPFVISADLLRRCAWLIKGFFEEQKQAA